LTLRTAAPGSRSGKFEDFISEVDQQ